MKVIEVKKIAEQWVSEHAAKIPGFAGAFYTGSISSLPDEQDYGTSSDVDLHVVIDGDMPENTKQVKFIYRGIILEPLYDSIQQYQTPEQLLANPFWGCHFTVPNIISDPSGHLTALQKAVARDFAKRQWVKERCQRELQQALSAVEKYLDVKSNDDYRIGRFCALMGSIVYGVCIPVLADLRPPTVRQCLVRCREVLMKYDKLSCFEDVLAVLGCAELAKSDAETILADTTNAFDKAVQVIKTSFFFDFDICEVARPISIGGSQKLVSNGNHREAVLFMMIIFNRSILAIQNDAPDDQKLPFLRSYQKSLDVLGFGTEKDFLAQVDKWKDILNQIQDITDEILDLNPEIRD